MTETRREFIVKSLAAGSGLVLSGAKTEAKEPVRDGFSIRFYATRWGFEGSMDEFCKRVKAEGYDGVEDWMPGNKQAEESLFEALDKYDLSYGALVGTSKNEFEGSLGEYSDNLNKALLKKPDFINSHAGKDYFQMDQCIQLIKLGLQRSKEAGIPIYQETHRGRMLFAPHICRHFLETIDELRLTLDISHWCVVAESLLSNQEDTVQLALSRTDHIHARIGHEEGPQVSEPRAPEWGRAKEAHFAWWDEVVRRKKSEGKSLTVTTEFGPPNYMWTTPYTRQPLADQWGINVYMMNEWRKRYV